MLLSHQAVKLLRPPDPLCLPAVLYCVAADVNLDARRRAQERIKAEMERDMQKGECLDGEGGVMRMGEETQHGSGEHQG